MMGGGLGSGGEGEREERGRERQVEVLLTHCDQVDANFTVLRQACHTVIVACRRGRKHRDGQVWEGSGGRGAHR